MAYIGKTPVIGNFVKLDSITVVNGQAAYTMQNGGANFTSYDNVNQFLVSLNGILQSPTDSFTVSGSTLTFASNLSTGDVIDFVMVLGNSLDIGTPSDNTVSLAKLTATGTKDATTFLRGDNTFATAQGAYESQLLHVRDEKSANTAGGAFTSGDWRTRTLNTVMTNEISGASLSSNQVTLPSGTYYVHAGARGYTVNVNKLKWYNTSDSSDVLIGDQARSDSSANANAFVSVMGRFTISAQKTFELQHRCETTRSDANGYGPAANFGVVEVFANVQIWKVA
jgi:hypothetical protein